MDYADMLDQHREGLKRADVNDSHTWLALLAVVRTAELAGRDLGPGTFAWAQHAAAVYEAVTALADAPVLPDGLGDASFPAPPPDSPALCSAAMRLSGALAQVFAEAACAERDPARRRTYTHVAATFTQAASCLRPTALDARGDQVAAIAD